MLIKKNPRSDFFLSSAFASFPPSRRHCWGRSGLLLRPKKKPEEFHTFFRLLPPLSRVIFFYSQRKIAEEKFSVYIFCCRGWKRAGESETIFLGSNRLTLMTLRLAIAVGWWFLLDSKFCYKNEFNGRWEFKMRFKLAAHRFSFLTAHCERGNVCSFAC